jgi:hypothetical protein
MDNAATESERLRIIGLSLVVSTPIAAFRGISPMAGGSDPASYLPVRHDRLVIAMAQ